MRPHKDAAQLKFVMAGLDPAIHAARTLAAPEPVDALVEPAHDDP